MSSSDLGSRVRLHFESQALYAMFKITLEPGHCKIFKMTCASSEDSVNLHIRAVSLIDKDPVFLHADAQTDRSVLRTSFCKFCCALCS